MREQGFKEGIAEFPTVKLVATIHTNSDTAKALAATEDMMTANPNLKGIFAGNEAACIGAVQALETAGKAGSIKLIAFDASPEQVEALKRGSIQALIVQNPFRMGYDGVKAAIDHIEGRAVEKRIDTGVTVVTLENLESAEVQKLINPEA
jgi:ribose transport system substrate-binding protein